jgi:aminoglycoside phosphotransferase (APT) family kinase protein
MTEIESVGSHCDSNDMVRSLRKLGLVNGRAAVFERLSGGVSSDIYKVSTDNTTFVVKRALERLNVPALWQVPVERSNFEYLWLETVARIVPGAVPKLLGHDRDENLIAMEFLDPDRHPVWKSLLRAGQADPAFAAAVGQKIVTVHAATAGNASLAKTFATEPIFKLIRIDPYLGAVAERHVHLASALSRLAERTLFTRVALVHGDVSPKNILCGPDGPVFLDAECAWFGDPAFDVAFCLNHLLLKCLWNRAASRDYLACFTALCESYLSGVHWESADCLEGRAAALLPSLLLARVDGTSPVEYITQTNDQILVRRFAMPFILQPVSRLDEIRSRWAIACAAK